jgi:hypothetical protein
VPNHQINLAVSLMSDYWEIERGIGTGPLMEWSAAHCYFLQ